MMSKRKVANVRSFTVERALRGRLPWTFDVDVARDRFVMKVRKDVRPVDIEAMAQALEGWGRALISAARQLRKGA
jgi:hypothetical protein